MQFKMETEEKPSLQYNAAHLLPLVSIKQETESLPDERQSVKKEFLSDEESVEKNDSAFYPQENQLSATNFAVELQASVITSHRDSEACIPSHNNIRTRRAARNDKRHQCDICPRSFKEKYKLKNHLFTHAKDRKREFDCHLCGTAFYTKPHLVVHMRIHNNKRLNCEVCGAPFTQKGNLKAHILRKHMDATQQLSTNAETPNYSSVNTKKELISDEEFIDEDHSSDSFGECQQSALAVDDDQRTTVSIVGKEKELCELCNNIFPKELIKTHMRLAHCYRIYKCDLCLQTFKQKRSLEYHLLSHTKDRKREFPCHSCEKKFFTDHGLQLHMKLHTGDTHNCKVCGSRFTDKHNLKVHLFRKHSGKSKPPTLKPQTPNYSSVNIKSELILDEETLDEEHCTDLASCA